MLESNKETASSIENRYYFKPIKDILEKKIKEIGKIKVLDHLTEVMRCAQPHVEELIQKRKYDGDITNVDQTRKNIAGNAFQCLVVYSLIGLQEKGELNTDLVITLKPKNHYLIEKYATIKVGDDIQKPDIDMLIYEYTESEKKPVMIYSIKTSLRERAGQTYRWKLLMDIATSDNCKTIKEKYSLSYDASGDFKVGFITTNFYNEIMNPQNQGMLRFFDFAYITKDGNWKKPISSFSEIVNDLNSIYK